MGPVVWYSAFLIPTMSDSEGCSKEVKAHKVIVNSQGSFTMRQDSKEESVITKGL